MNAAALTGALTMSLCTLFPFSCSFPIAQLHRIVFEEIGEMAGALSYIHVLVLINISGLNNAVHQFLEKTELLQKGYLR